MKRILLILCMTLFLLLTGCSKDTEPNEEEKELKILCPVGAPAAAFYKMAQNENFMTNSSPSNIVALMQEEEGADIVVIDTVSGIQAINKGADYQMASTITLGNFFLASTGNDEDEVMDETDYIVLFAQGSFPDKIFAYLYPELYDGVHFVNAVSDAQNCLISGVNIADDNKSVDYVFIAQPALFAAMKKNENAKVYEDIQKLYREKSSSSMIQASVFVRKSADKKKAQEFLDSLKKDIDEAIGDPDTVLDYLGVLDEDECKSRYGMPANILAAVLKQNNAIGLGYVNAYDNKDAIDAFVQLFGLEKTDEEIYFR